MTGVELFLAGLILAVLVLVLLIKGHTQMSFSAERKERGKLAADVSVLRSVVEQRLLSRVDAVEARINRLESGGDAETAPEPETAAAEKKPEKEGPLAVSAPSAPLPRRVTGKNAGDYLRKKL